MQFLHVDWDLLLTRHSPVCVCVCVLSGQVPRHYIIVGCMPLSAARMIWCALDILCVHLCAMAMANRGVTAVRVCVDDAKMVAVLLVRRPHFVYVFMSRADQGWLPLTVFASFEGVAPAVLPNHYSTVSGRLCICVCPGHPWNVKR